MLKTKILLLSSIVPAAVWAASANMGPSRLIVQVVCAVAMSFLIFLAILRVTERARPGRHRVGKRSRVTAALAMTPPLPLQPRQAPFSWRGYVRGARRGNVGT
jgi:hypothetical protein